MAKNEVHFLNSRVEHHQQSVLSSQALGVWANSEYAKHATSDATRKAYRSDMHQFERWGGSLPTTEETVICYLEQHAAILSVRTLMRRLAALRAWHLYQGFHDPTAHPIITKTLSGIARLHGKPKKKAKALTPEALYQIVAMLNTKESLYAMRDKALLQLGFFGALRRSELVAIYYEHIRWEKEGIEIVLPVSKTDQTRKGQYCAIPYGHHTVLCPVTALKQWLDCAAIQQGPIFRRILSNRCIHQQALTPLSVNHILKKHALSAGLTAVESLSGHSLRRGLATSAARAASPLPAIMRAGRWKQSNTVIEYIEESERFHENAAFKVMEGFNPDSK